MEFKQNEFNSEKIANSWKTILLVAESFFATWAMMRIGNFSATNIIAVLFFGLSFSFFKQLKKQIYILNDATLKNHKLIAVILSAIFTLFYLLDVRKAIVGDLNN